MRTVRSEIKQAYFSKIILVIATNDSESLSECRRIYLLPLANKYILTKVDFELSCKRCELMRLDM